MQINYSNLDTCCHTWEKDSGFYVSVCVTYEEPDYYPPQGLIQLEVCPRCGLVRVPNLAESWRGIVIATTNKEKV